jgi:hypothetical protein
MRTRVCCLREPGATPAGLTPQFARSQTLNGGSGQGGKVVQHPEPLQRHYRGGRQGYSD